jgi:hemolysin D
MRAAAHKVVALHGAVAVPTVEPHSEFAPALDYLAAPPSPIRIRLMATICALCASAIAISCFAKIDIYATAQARIQPAGRSKLIQPLATGKVSAVHVSNGTLVRKGELLLELDATESSADRTTDLESAGALRAEIARRRVAIDSARTERWQAAPAIAFEPGIAPSLRAREQAVLAADLANLRQTVQALEAKVAESSTRSGALRATIAEQERTVAALQKRFEMTESLFNQTLASRAAVIDAEQAVSEQRTRLAGLQGELLSSEAAMRSGTAELRRALASFIAINTQALVEAEAKGDGAAQNLIKSSARLGHTRLLAPIDGTVQELAVTTIGQVVVLGQQLMTIVPKNSTLEVDALLANKDIGFVESGQTAVLKLDAFPFTRYGTLSGKVVRISHDAVDSEQALSLANRSSSSRIAFTPSKDLVYPVTAALERTNILVDNKSIPVLPGMTGTLEIRTGQRRVIEFLLSPILEVTAAAGHER